MAISEKVDTISINPSKISDKNKTLVAKGLSEIFELDYEEVLENRKKYGTNELKKGKTNTFFSLLLESLGDPIIKILLKYLIVNI